MSTTIGKGVKITGSLTADEPVSIVGTFNGDVLVANHSVTVETGGRVDGAVTARVITVQGGSAGRLIARDVVRLLEGAMVKADVTSPKLALEDGAIFNGRVDGGARAEAAAGRPVSVGARRRLQRADQRARAHPGLEHRAAQHQWDQDRVYHHDGEP
jgi:cytoskeletal protein CcmA (bactofilin family)